MNIADPVLWLGVLIAFYLTEMLWFYLKRLLLRRLAIPLSRRKKMLAALAYSAVAKNVLIIWQLFGPLVLGLVLLTHVISDQYSYILEYVVVALVFLIPSAIAFKSYFANYHPRDNRSLVTAISRAKFWR
ncbi:hypothetical protein DBIPINDM_001875 [Mesorhizobium sp. AR02]|uniref:hypothetical protein n=1 Tax=Mesorhizobium sp. AR02 TaxID=2865837 RepID=UPI00215E4BA5|nr:hypothetical protein [Mesorhizobium sp. AR02]UVK55367.1 hypothetical protein DBIPINDM_001875 [Mesorhizobium sp. AR02]